VTRIQFLKTDRIDKFVSVPGRYQFTEAGRWKWLQRQAWRFLQWSGAIKASVDHTFAFERVEFDGQDLINNILKQRSEIFEHHHGEPKTLLIGSEDFEQLMGLPQINSAMSFFAELHGGYGGERRIFNLQVRVIPWMRGTLVLT
jgi:hypothetical protein